MQGQGQVVWERGDHFFEAINLKYDCIQINLFETFVVSYNNCSLPNNVNLQTSSIRSELKSVRSVECCDNTEAIRISELKNHLYKM